MSLTPFLPYRGIDHAGGEYVRHHLQVLERASELSVFAPAWKVNNEHQNDMDPQAQPLLLLGRTLLRTPGLRMLARAWSLMRGPGLGGAFDLALRWDKQVHALARAADIVEFQYSEAGAYAGWFRKHAPNARLVLVVHDVVAQRWERRLASDEKRSAWSSSRLRATACREIRSERRAVAAVDIVVTLNEKDRDLIASSAPPGTTIKVLDPCLDSAAATAVERRWGPVARAQNVLFVGAFSREENAEGARWFLDQVWEPVKLRVPDARLVLAGSRPPDWLLARAARDRSVEVTGYVNDLSSVYAEASAVIVPLHLGAGVKFKTITAMLWQLPVVATSIGAEGVGHRDCFVAVADDPHGFGCGVVKALLDPEAARTATGLARTWAADRFAFDRFEQSLLDAYGLQGSRTSSARDTSPTRMFTEGNTGLADPGHLPTGASSCDSSS